MLPEIQIFHWDPPPHLGGQKPSVLITTLFSALTASLMLLYLEEEKKRNFMERNFGFGN